MAKTRTSAASKEEFEYRAEMKQLLHLIVHSLYTHRDIFLRELISNASDALNKIRFRQLTDKNVVDPDLDYEIRIEVDEKEKTFAIEDTGIGMTREELIENIGTVASSGTLQFIRKLQEEGKPIDTSLIGQFGVGFYSVFMVADEVTIETRHADPGSKAYRWVSDGQGTFTIEPADRERRGTRVSFRFKDDAAEFASADRIKEIIHKYSNFVDFPIYVNGQRVNTIQAIWHKPKDQISEKELEEFYKFLTNDLRAPLAHLHVSVEGAVNFKALIFIPETAPPLFLRETLERSLHLYSNKVFITDDSKELLPEYLRFVRGVVDTEDLPLNVSREVTQSSPAMAKIRNVLTGKILGFLEELAQNEPQKYKTFYQQFGPLFKTGVNTDFSNRERIIELLRFESTRTEKGEYISLKDYVERMKEDQKAIYYLSGDSREEVENNPNLEYFKKNDIEVLLLTEPVDVFVVPTLGEYKGKPFQSIEKADLDLKEQEGGEEALGKGLAEALIKTFKETLGDRVEDVIASKRLVDSPVTLVVGREGLDRQMEKMMKLMDRDYSGSKRILEVNLSHPLIKNLGRLNLGDGSDPLLRKCILQLYEGALLIDGNLKNPTEFVRRMTEIMEEATKGS